MAQPLVPPSLPLRVRGTQRAADILVDTLVKAGVEVIFGIPGGTIVALNDALLDRPEIRVVTTRHESGAMFAAAGYARATGKTGVVLVTSGPGALNCMTGIASAYCDHLPVLVIAGEVPRPFFGRGALQEGSSAHLNVVSMARHVTKMSVELTEPNSASSILLDAIDTTLRGRPGPVLVTVPLDVSVAEVPRAGVVASTTTGNDVNRGLVRKVAGALEQSRRPVVLAGSGLRWGDAASELRELAERLQVPVMTTMKGKGVFPESHPLSLGVFGYGAHPSTRAYLEGGVDVVLAVGTALTDPATDGWSDLLKPTGHFFHIDAEPSHIGRNYPVSVGLVGPAEFLLREILHETRSTPRAVRQFVVSTHTDPAVIENGPDGRIAPQRALHELQNGMPPSTIFTCDIGEHLLFAVHYLRIEDASAFVTMTGLASMGSAIPGAIGTKLGQPERPCVAICGDGGFGMSVGELATAVQASVPIIVAVLNDGRYGMVEMGHIALYGRSPEYPCTELRIDQLAEGVGAKAIVIERAGEIAALDLAAEVSAGPLVLDIRIDRSFKMPRNKRFEDLRDCIHSPLGEG